MRPLIDYQQAKTTLFVIFTFKTQHHHLLTIEVAGLNDDVFRHPVMVESPTVLDINTKKRLVPVMTTSRLLSQQMFKVTKCYLEADCFSFCP